MSTVEATAPPESSSNCGPPVAPSALLIDVVQQLSEAKSVGTLIRIVKSAARQLVGADGATFVLREGENCHYVDEDAIEPLWKGQSFPMRICVSGWVMRNRQPAIIPDVEADDRIPQEIYRRTFVKSMVMVPIRSLSPVGAIGVYWQETNCPTTDTVRWLQSLADSTALGFEHVRALAELERLHERAQMLNQEALRLRKEAAARDQPKLMKMCLVTKQMQVDDEWISLEAFLEDRCGITISHGLSPEGRTRLDDQ